MTLHHLNLQEPIREMILQEIALDQSNGTLWISDRLSPTGKADYPSLLETAARQHNDNWLAAELSVKRRLNLQEQRRKPKGGYTMVSVPVNANMVLAEGEFNRFYLRGLCRYAIDNGISHLIVYRAKAVAVPRPESERMINTTIPVAALLDDLRKNHLGLDTALGLPPGPNSGLSARLP